MKSCVFAGTFDPITIGHEYVIKKCVKKFDKVFLVIGANPQKSPLFTIKERLEIIKETFKDENKVVIVSYEDKKDDYAGFLKEQGVTIYVRGVRSKNDVIFENEMKKKNEKLYPFIKTIYFKTPKKYKEISSTLVKELIENGKDFYKFLPEKSKETLAKILDSKAE